MYLSLSDFDHLHDDQTVRFREEIVNGIPVVIVVYMIANDELWNKYLGDECRGPVFDKATGELLSLPFEKFFNVNEKSFTQAHVVRNHHIDYVLDKRDGSMITPANIGGRVVLKTKKSFYSDVAMDANHHVPPNVYLFCDRMLTVGLCPIFEYTSPDNKVVIDYGEQPKFVLLAIRDMLTGAYLRYDSVADVADQYNIPPVDRWGLIGDNMIDSLLSAASTVQDREGWVIYTPNGRFKIKTKWYMDRHHLIDVRERDIARYVLDETLDDMIPNLIEAEADMETVRRIEMDVARGLADIYSSITNHSAQAALVPAGKERADWVSSNAGELSKFVHRATRGIENKDEVIRDFYRQRYLSNFSLRSIGNPNFRKIENDDE